ncbi:MAG: peptidase MA family metallohydrolase [Anaerolineae bacterium]
MSPRCHRLRWSYAIFVALLLLTPATPLLGQAEGPATGYTYTFGQTLEITLSLPLEPSPPAEANLSLRIGEEVTESHTLRVEAGRAQYRRDLREYPLPPFARVTYWWTYTDKDGNLQRVGEISFLYEDNRFQWQEITEDDITLKWVAGSREQMAPALDVARNAQQDLEIIAQDIEPSTVSIYIYPSKPDLRLALRLSGREWIAGQAYPEVGVVLLAIPPSDETYLELQRDLPHELTHLVLYRRLGARGYETLPTWLNEGLASNFEQRPEPAYYLALQSAAEEENFIPLADLCTPFYAMPTNRLVLAYAESQSVVDYLRRTYGWAGINTLLKTYEDGFGCSEGLEQALGFNLSTLQREWRVWLQEGKQPVEESRRLRTLGRIALQDIAPWIFLLIFLSLPATLFIFAGRIQKHRD